MFQVRDGVLAERQGFYLANEGERGEDEVTEEFAAQYYSAVPGGAASGGGGPGAARTAPRLLAEALSSRSGGPVEVRVAERGDKRRLRELAERNAAARSRPGQAARRAGAASSGSTRWPHSQEALDLESLPVRIEGFDVSNLGADHTVASMVVFEGGAPKKADYRRFKIRGDRTTEPTGRPSAGQAPARMTLRPWTRSWRGALGILQQADISPHDPERDASFAALPDLIVIDGGKGQLSAAMRALGPLVESGMAVIGLAKRIEEVFVPGERDPVVLAKRLGCAAPAAAGARRGAPVRARLITGPAATRR